MKPFVLALALGLAAGAAPCSGHGQALAGDNWSYRATDFDWDRYHARQDACAEKDRLVEACARGDCDELALRQATRECSAWGPGSETISPCIQV